MIMLCFFFGAPGVIPMGGASAGAPNALELDAGLVSAALALEVHDLDAVVVFGVPPAKAHLAVG
jgi:hypothetical protein